MKSGGCSKPNSKCCASNRVDEGTTSQHPNRKPHQPSDQNCHQHSHHSESNYKHETSKVKNGGCSKANSKCCTSSVGDEGSTSSQHSHQKARQPSDHNSHQPIQKVSCNSDSNCTQQTDEMKSGGCSKPNSKCCPPNVDVGTTRPHQNIQGVSGHSDSNCTQQTDEMKSGGCSKPNSKCCSSKGSDVGTTRPHQNIQGISGHSDSNCTQQTVEMKSGGCSDPSSKCCTSNERDKGATCVSNSPSLIDSKKETEAPINCFAFVQRNEVLICDRDNKVIRFVIDDAHMPSTSSSKRNIDNDRRLCFLTHGHDVADLLTPCFDSAGRHLKDEEENDLEPCAFCDEEDAHVHAHFYNEKYCFADNAESSNTKKAVVDPFFLASVVLRRAPIGIDDSNAEGYHILPSCGLLPQNQPCNSKEYKRLLDSTENGTPLCHEPCCHDYYFKPNSEGKEKKRGRKLYPVWHHDHIDYLVYHESSESVHLEYPCDSCGEMDIHGKFNFIGRRKWRTSSKSKEIQLNIFEIPSKPFSIVEAFSVLYETNSSRTNVCRRACCVAKKSSCSAQNGRPQINMTEKAATSGRSQFYVKGICCSSEVPAVEAIVNQLRGVHNLSINVTTRNVYVEHNLSTVTAAKIKSSLDKNGFAASIIKDAGVKNTQTKANNTSIVQSQLFVRGICCPAEIPSIDEIIKPLPGVKKVSVNVTTKIVYLEHDCSMISIQEIGKKLSLNNFEATVQKDGKCPVRKEMNSNIENTSNTELSVKIAITLSGVFWSISMLSYIPGWNNFKYFALCAVLLGLPPIALKAISTLRRKHFDANCLMFLAVVGALCLREFTEAAAVSFLYSISDILETLATRKARDALSEIVNLRPESANLIDPATDNVSVISADDVLPGQRLLVRPGEKIPCDGIILEGSSVVDESALTGESRPIKKSLNDDVSGGTINIGRSPLVVNATVTVDNSAVARLIQLVEKAQANRSPTERLVDKFAKLYTPIIVFSAFLMCTVPWSYGEEIGKIWFHIGLTTMIVACPCALIISTPVTYVAGLAALAKLGVIVKGGAHLEALGRVGIIALDKTGTLTEGKFKLLHLDLIRNDFNRKDVLKILTALEGPSIHPLANALIEAAKNEGIEPVVGNAKDHTILKGEGVSAYYNGSMVYVGNQRLFNRINMYSELNSSTKEKVDYWSNLGGTVGYIGVEGFGIIAAYCAADAVREEAKSVVSQLKGLGIEVSMLTGDSVCAAAAIGKQVGIADPNICAELLPHEKLNLVQAMKENKIESVSFLCNGKKQDFVLMCGDGINDTPALALANVGVAMGAGAALALETSDVTLMDDNLNKLLCAVKMGRTVIATIKENMIFSVLSKLLVIVYIIFKGANLWIAISCDVGSMLIVTLNGMKLLPHSRKAHDMPDNECTPLLA